MSKINDFHSEINNLRSVKDHRIPYDFNYGINQNQFSAPWRSSMKQRFIGLIINSWGVHACGFIIAGCVALTFFDAFYRQKFYSPTQQANIFNQRDNLGEKFVFNHKNQRGNLGKWNHNFNCWEGEANCGRDFDWVKK